MQQKQISQAKRAYERKQDKDRVRVVSMQYGLDGLVHNEFNNPKLYSFEIYFVNTFRLTDCFTAELGQYVANEIRFYLDLMC